MRKCLDSGKGQLPYNRDTKQPSGGTGHAKDITDFLAALKVALERTASRRGGGVFHNAPCQVA